MKTIIWSRSARDDLAGIDGYYRQLNPLFAAKVGRLAIRAALLLAEYPDAGERLDGHGRRRWLVANTPYLLLYRVVGNELRIIRVMHHAQDWKPGP